MILGTANSKNGVAIRLTDERWEHIKRGHPDIKAGDKKRIVSTIENPNWIFKGKKGALGAVSPLNGIFFVVIYKEGENGGFVLTAFRTNKLNWLFKKEILWSKQR